MVVISFGIWLALFMLLRVNIFYQHPLFSHTINYSLWKESPQIWKMKSQDQADLEENLSVALTLSAYKDYSSE